MYKLNCKECETDFDSPRKNAIFCSKDCNVNNQRKEGKTQRKNGCKNCGEPVLVGRVYCTSCFTMFRNKPSKDMTRNTKCEICKEEKTLETTKFKDGYWARSCRKCAASKRRNHVKKSKILAIDYKGGKCQVCGYSKCNTALEFHHLDPTKKDFEIARKKLVVLTDELKNELDKTVLICSNCHREEHQRLKDNLPSLLTPKVYTEPYVEIC